MDQSVDPNFAIVTLGVRDLERSASFYAALGWEQRGNPSDGILWFRTSGTWVGLFGYDALAEDAGIESLATLPAYRGITLALNLPSEQAVDNGFEVFMKAGATLVKPAEHASWGGYSGYLADPDGHLWELAHNPHFPIDEQGRIDIP